MGDFEAADYGDALVCAKCPKCNSTDRFTVVINRKGIDWNEEDGKPDLLLDFLVCECGYEGCISNKVV